jgi:F-type H+-transporting ATPase subunit alpha
LDKATQSQLARGQRLTEILKQPQYQPIDVEKQVLIIWAASNGFLDDVPVDQSRRFESELVRFMENAQAGLLQRIREKKALTDDIKADLKQALTDFKDNWNLNDSTAVATTGTPAAASTATQTNAAGA